MIKNLLPNEWQNVKLVNVLDSISNGTTNKQNKDNKGYRVSRIETISHGVIDLEKTNFIELNHENYNKFKLNDGDILFSHINSTSHLGKTAIYFNSMGKLIHGMNLLRLVPKKSKIIPKFLLYLLKDEKARHIFKQDANEQLINLV